jgi:hypothetical protein
MPMSLPTYIDRMLDPVSDCLTPEVADRLAHLSVDPEVQARIDDLADRNTEGELSSEEKAELESYIRVGNVIAILQAKARKRINESEAA